MSTAASRQYNWVDDKNNVIAITASRMDTEFDNVITKLNQKCIIKATAPTSPMAGMLWFDSTNKILKQYRNAEWIIMGAVHVGTSAPSTVQEGDLWYDSTNNLLKSYNGSAWGWAAGALGTEGAIPVYTGTASLGTVSPGTVGYPLVSLGTVPPAYGLLGSEGLKTNLITTANALLKTATGDVTYGGTDMNTTSQNTLPGGAYGFYPQIKNSSNDAIQCQMAGGQNSNTSQPGTTSIASISFVSDTGTTTASQRYITASGEDMWIFLLIDKLTKRIISGYQAPDHPAYGNGGNFEKVPHPFGSYDETKHEIILLDVETCNQLKSEATEEKSMLTLVHEEYKPDMTKEEVYVPLHSGKFLGKAPVMIEKIPEYITVRKLTKLTDQEKQAKKDKADQDNIKYEQKKQKKIVDKASAKDKLVILGLTEDEIEALK